MNDQEYIAGALVTEAPVNAEMKERFKNPIAMSALLNLMHQIARASESLDLLKKFYFYGKIKRPIPVLNGGVYDVESAKTSVGPDVTQRLEQPNVIRLIHALIGLQTEIGGELLPVLFSHIRDGAPMDAVNLAEEAGDVFWYMAILVDVMGTTFSDIMARNNRKLRARYNDKFLAAEAEQRDPLKERAAMEDAIMMKLDGAEQVCHILSREAEKFGLSPLAFLETLERIIQQRDNLLDMGISAMGDLA